MRIEFSELADDARLWIFAASDPLTGERADALLREVDDYLEQWKAHGEILRCARDWRNDRFLAIGVDQSTAGASGCSIDGLFRALQRLQSSLGTSLVGGGRVFYRDNDGAIHVTDRPGFARGAAAGEINRETLVYDTSVVTAGDYRTKFERPMGESWHRDLATTLVR